jgi:hypothetical protein
MSQSYSEYVSSEGHMIIPYAHKNGGGYAAEGLQGDRNFTGPFVLEAWEPRQRLTYPSQTYPITSNANYYSGEYWTLSETYHNETDPRYSTSTHSRADDPFYGGSGRRGHSYHDEEGEESFGDDSGSPIAIAGFKVHGGAYVEIRKDQRYPPEQPPKSKSREEPKGRGKKKQKDKWNDKRKDGEDGDGETPDEEIREERNRWEFDTSVWTEDIKSSQSLEMMLPDPLLCDGVDF